MLQSQNWCGYGDVGNILKKSPMFKRLFHLKKNQLSKIEYWKKWELFELIEDLHKAEKLLSTCKAGYSGEFISAEDFHRAFVDELYNIEFDNVADFTLMWRWFMPNCIWDDFTGTEGLELGSRIFARLDRWKRNHDFVPETKVSLNGELP